MPRALAIGAVVLAIAALAAFVVARGSSLWKAPADAAGSSGGSSGAPSVAASSAKSAARDDEPTFDDWPKPAAVLVLTGEQHGYLEPCGCSEKQSGGVARRSDLMKQLRAKGWPAAGLDLGGTVTRSRKQTEFKFAAIADALRALEYRGVGLGPEELALSATFLLSEHLPAEGDRPALAFLGSNQTFFGTPDLDGGPKKVVAFELGGVKIGSAMVLGEDHQRGIFPEGASADVTFTPPAEALAEAAAKLAEAGTQINVLLSYAGLEESRALAKQFPQFDVVVSAGGPEDPHAVPERIGDAWLLTVGQKGKYAGVLGLYPHDAKTPLRYELVDLNRDRFRHDAAMDAVMRDYQQSLQDNLVEVFADLPEDFPPGDGTYVGAARCGECHKQAFVKWRTTGHAKAYVTLSEGRKDLEPGRTWVDRKFDPDCLACHVTGWNPQEVYPYVSGFLPEAIAADKGEPHRFATLQGQQCENCHGPGGKHSDVLERWMKDAKSVPQAELADANRSVHVEYGTAKQSLCVKCHDYENSPKFEFESYWAKINHKGLRD